MRLFTSLVLGLALLIAVSSASRAGEDDYNVGDFVRFSGVVKGPDIKIEYIMFDPGKKVATFGMTDRLGRAVGSFILALNEERLIAVKRECSQGCISYILILRLVEVRETGRVWLKQSVDTRTFRNDGIF